MQVVSLALGEVQGDCRWPTASRLCHCPSAWDRHCLPRAPRRWMCPSPFLLPLRRCKLHIKLTTFSISVMPHVFKALFKEQAESYICPRVGQGCKAFHPPGPWGGARVGCGSGTHASIRSTTDPVIFLPNCALDQLTEPIQGLIHHLSKLLTGQHCNSQERGGIWAWARK